MADPRSHPRFRELMRTLRIHADVAAGEANWRDASTALLSAMGDVRSALNITMAQGDDDEQSQDRQE